MNRDDRLPVFYIKPATQRRELDPNAPIKEQIATLKWYLENLAPPDLMPLLTFSPGLSEYIADPQYQINRRNYRVRAQNATRFAAAMKEGQWYVTGETVSFDSDGCLADGRHRFAAAWRANATFQSYAVFGLDPAAFVHIDSGKSRNGSDVLTLLGYDRGGQRAQAARWSIILTSDNPDDRSFTASNAQIKVKHDEMDASGQLEAALKDGEAVHRQFGLLAKGSTTAIAWLYRTHGFGEAVDKLILGLRASREPARGLINHLHRLAHQTNAKGQFLQLAEPIRNRALAATLNAYVQERETRIRFPDDFPKFPWA